LWLCQPVKHCPTSRTKNMERTVMDRPLCRSQFLID
jgi:hypothetical protein